MALASDVTDRIAVETLIISLGRWLDGLGGDPHDIYDREVFVKSPRAELRGFDEVAGFAQRAFVQGEKTQHTHTDLLIEVEGDKAVAYANGTTHFYEPGSPPYRSAGGRTRYELIRRELGWRIARMDMEITWLSGGMPAMPSS